MSTGLKINHVTDEATPDTYIEHRAFLSKWDVFIAGWGSGGGARFFGRYDMFVDARAACIVAQHEFDYHRGDR